MKNLSLLVLLMALLLSCSKEHDEIAPLNKPGNAPVEGTTSQKPGGFAVSRLTNLSNGRSASSVPHQVKFDLGEVKASKEYLFILSNSGDVPVFDINIAIDHSQFEVSPRRIDTLGVNGTANNLLPLITVGIKHGVALNGVGQLDLLEQGTHTGIVSIKGKTIISGDTVEVTADIEMIIEAKVADIDIYINDNLLNLGQPDFQSIGFVRSDGYYIPENSNIKVANTGNVSISLKYSKIQYADGGNISEDEEITLGNNESKVFNWSASTSDNVMITIDGKNTIMKHSKITQQKDGKGYISLRSR